MLRSITIITLAAVLAGCAGGPTPYAPAGDSRYGLTEQQFPNKLQRQLADRPRYGGDLSALSRR